ncbi:MAG: ribose-phosphate diphosphokinase [Desulfovibrionaceae bacterium]
MQGELKILTGTSNPQLARDICSYLGCELTPLICDRFSDGEIRVEIGGNVRGSDVFVVQSTCAPVNESLMELCLILDTLKRSSVARVTAIIPYYGYARQDRKLSPRTPISAKLVSDFIVVSGTNRVVTIDLHAGQIQGFFNIPVDNLYATPVLLRYLMELQEEMVVVSPDAGGVERARAYAKKLSSNLAIVDKRRDTPNQAKAMNLVGDVNGKLAVIIDDMIDTAGTLCAAAEVLIDRGAKEVIALATHPVLSGNAIEKINASAFSRIVVTDTIPLGDKLAACDKICVLPMGELLARAIYNIHTETSVSVLFV